MSDTLYNTVSAAKKLGCSHSSVSRKCAEHGIGRRIGPSLVLTEADLARLKKLLPAKPGNPNFVAGNYFGRPPKKSKKQ